MKALTTRLLIRVATATRVLGIPVSESDSASVAVPAPQTIRACIMGFGPKVYGFCTDSEEGQIRCSGDCRTIVHCNFNLEKDLRWCQIGQTCYEDTFGYDAYCA
ncbi:hypothetical protein F4777DRAFT_553086 [Nemania sp. FL0916]|nr:hypothetical protein F4777DRAFT_553086 [Nemania sp. FL0916]